MIPALAYAPRPTPLGRSSALAASVHLGAFAVLAFAFSSPIVLCALLLAVVVAGVAAGARRQVAVALRASLVLGLLLVAVNVLVAGRGETILVRGWELPLLGQTDVTLEALVAGLVTAMRLAVVIVAFAVHSAVVDPDRLLRGLRPLARRSAMTATLIARMVPLAAADHARLREAAALRGPAAAPAGRTRILRRLVAGALDRAVDTAATLELRGYSRGAPRAAGPRRRGPDDRLFAASGVAALALGVAALVSGAGGFDAYPALEIATSPGTLAVATVLPALAVAPVAGSKLRSRRVASPRASAAPSTLAGGADA
ncbi:hypothetical protein HJD18_06200 [Thermoleophilia bacterium SCSIO 60948]|nr:hypothetical protein HJD18_06200 [Thermoleophilia bacterium SCSIO 60948]